MNTVGDTNVCCDSLIDARMWASEMESCTATEIILRPQASGVCVRDRARDRQSQPQTVFLRRKERFE